MPPSFLPADRLDRISRARQALIDGASVGSTSVTVEPWIERSWRRCLNEGRRPDQRVDFDEVTRQAMSRVSERSRLMVEAARPVLHRLARAIENTRYFAILTDADGVVVDVQGQIDRNDRRASVIARIGVDLSEHAVGTTAIGAALTELQPVALHRGEHFFADTSVYSCAGAPLFGPTGQCIGMLDLTGVDVVERPELKHLVAQSARSIENGLLLSQAHAITLRLNWPGRALGNDDDGLMNLDADGLVIGLNAAARQMLALPQLAHDQPVHCADLFAMPWQALFDAASHDREAQEVPLWSGLRLRVQAQSSHPARPRAQAPVQAPPMPLKDLETRMIIQAVDAARGNVAEAAKALGISRATVYRKLSPRRN